MSARDRLRAAVALRAGGLPRAYWSIWTGTLVNRLGTFVDPFLALYLTTVRGFGVGTAGLVVALNGAGSIASQLVGGQLADRVGRRATLAGGMIASAVLLLALAVVHALALIVLVAVALGVVGDIYRPAGQAAVADLVPFADRRRAAGLIFWAVNLGFSVAAVAGGLLATAGYGLLFALDAATCLAYGLIVLRSVPETRPTAARAPGAPGWRAVLADRPVVVLLVVQLAAALALIQLFSTLPLAMDHDGLGPATYGWVIALNGVTIVAVHPVIAPRLLRRDPSRVLVASLGLMGAAFLGMAVADGATAYALTSVVFSLGEIMNAATAPGLIAELAPPALRGRYSGAYGLTFGVAAAIGPILGSQLLGPGDSSAPWLANAALCLVGIGGQLALAGTLRRRRASAAAGASSLASAT